MTTPDDPADAGEPSSTPATEAELDVLRAELRELRQENERLRADVSAGGTVVAAPPRPGRARSAISILMVVVGALLVPVSITSVWLRNQLVDTDRYVETVAPLARDRSVQEAAGKRITEALFANVDVRAEVQDVLPERAAFLAVPITSGLHTVVGDVVDRVLSSERFHELWDRANRVAHEQLVSVLTNASGRKGVVQVDLSQVVGDAAQRLSALGLPFFDRAVGKDVVLDVFQSEDVARAQSVFSLFNRLATILPWFTILLLVASVFVSPDRRRGVVAASTGLVLGASSLLITVGIGRGLYLNALPTGASIPANEVIFDTLVRFLRGSTRSVLAIGLVVLLVALVLGPSGPAVRLRAAVARLWRRAGAGADEHGVDFGPVGAFAARNLVALRIAVGVGALLVLLAQGRPSAGTIFWIVVGSLVVLGIVEFVARAGAHHVAAATDAPDLPLGQSGGSAATS